MIAFDVKPQCSLRRKRHSAPVAKSAGAARRQSRFRASPCYLFAYGTLLRGTPDGVINRLIRDFLRPRCRAYINGRLHDLGTYPGAVPAPARSDKIFGQLFTVARPERVFPALDAYEGYSRGYPQQSEFVRRSATAMRLPCQRPLTAWVYYYNWHPGQAPRLRSGDYLSLFYTPGEVVRGVKTPPPAERTPPRKRVDATAHP